jgi:galactokinase
MEPVEIHREFERVYGRTPRLCQAPGRVNLIGEHTDYNDGFVMPVAIDLRTTVAVAPRTDRRLQLHSLNFGESVEFALPEPGEQPVRTQPMGHWSDYVCGVAVTIERAGYRLHGADLLIYGAVPIGSGLSSSAALEVAAGLALLESVGHTLPGSELARLCQRAENDYVGMRCGIMDQFTSSCGRAGYAILLDCRSLEHRLLAVPDVQVVVCNTMIRHRLAGGEYNRRRAECEEALRLLRDAVPDLGALRDVSLELLHSQRQRMPQAVYRRALHVVSENQRVLEAAAALDRRDLGTFGRLLGESHRSLRDDFEVSCDELDLMVHLAAGVEGVFGARMTGGGFGGCTVNLVRTDCVDSFGRLITDGYRRATSLTPEIYVCRAADGAGRVDLS